MPSASNALCPRHLLMRNRPRPRRLGHAKVKGIVHVGLVHLGNEQAHGAHHDHGVGGLNAYRPRCQTSHFLQMRRNSMQLIHDALGSVAIARHDAVGQGTVVHADRTAVWCSLHILRKGTKRSSSFFSSSAYSSSVYSIFLNTRQGRHSCQGSHAPSRHIEQPRRQRLR